MANGAIQSIIVKEKVSNRDNWYAIIIFTFFTIFSLLFYKNKLGLDSDIKQWRLLN
jgi:hypothetical protein